MDGLGPPGSISCSQPDRRWYNIKRVTTDGGYDRENVYEAVAKLGADAVIPPRKDVKPCDKPVMKRRNEHIAHRKRTGKRQWRKDTGQHQQARVRQSGGDDGSNRGLQGGMIPALLLIACAGPTTPGDADPTDSSTSTWTAPTTEMGETGDSAEASDTDDTGAGPSELDLQLADLLAALDDPPTALGPAPAVDPAVVA